MDKNYRKLKILSEYKYIKANTGATYMATDAAHTTN